MSNFDPTRFYLNRLLYNLRNITQVGQNQGIQLPPGGGPSTGLGIALSNLASLNNLTMKEKRLALSELFANEKLYLNPQEASQFLKEVMKLPHEMRMLLLMMALESSPLEVKTAIKQKLGQLIEQGLNPLAVPLDELQEMLSKSSKEGADKLIKLMQGNAMLRAGSGQQLAEMAIALGKLSDKVKNSTQETLETLMLLYIPWYPLAAEQKLALSFEFGGEEEEAGEKEIFIVIFLETNSLGRFKVVVHEVEPLQVAVNLFHEEIAKEIVPVLESKLNGFLADEGLPAAIFDTSCIKPEHNVPLTPALSPNGGEGANVPLTLSSSPVGERKQSDNSEESERETAGFKKATRQPDQKHIIVQPGSRISLLVLNSAYFIARSIFEADEEGRLLQKNQ